MTLLRALAVLLPLIAPARADDLHATWIDPEGLRLERVLAPPPAGASPEAQSDLAAVRQATAGRTEEDERRIIADLPCTLDRFTGQLGPAFTASTMPVTAALIERVFQDGELAVLAAKRAVGRSRPYTLDSSLRTFGHLSDSTSYPSGHSTFGHLAATILADLVPAKREALFARADAYARNRLMAGTHFPTDLEAGKIVAAVIADTLFRDTGFRQALDSAREEVRRAEHAR